MTVLRSILFGLTFYGGVVVIGIIYIPLAFLPSRIGAPFFRLWVRLALFCTREIAGIKYRIVLADRASIPQTPVIFAAKHQSAWETIAFNEIVPHSAFVLKKELLKMPFFGWYLRKMPHISVDRSAGSSAMRDLITGGKQMIRNGNSIIIYPQGTRVQPGEDTPYHPGVFALYKALNVPVVPVALNSGRLWPRNSILKHAGMVTVKILPSIPPGLDRKTFMAQLEQMIETEIQRLEQIDDDPVDNCVEQKS